MSIRCRQITKEKLEAAGHKIVNFVPHEMREATEIAFKMWAADSGEDCKQFLAFTCRRD